MIKIPERIKTAIIECAKCNEKARICEHEIIKWLEDMHLTEETASKPEKDMTNAFIDYCQMTNNPQELIEIIENL